MSFGNFGDSTKKWILYLTWDESGKVNEEIIGRGDWVKKMIRTQCESEMALHTLECFHFEDDVT